MKDVLLQMNSHGLNPESVVADGRIHRFKVDPKDSGKAGWYVGFENKSKSGKTYYVFTYGNYKTGLKTIYKPNYALSDEEAIQIKRQINDAKKKAQREKELEYGEKSHDFLNQWLDAKNWEAKSVVDTIYFKSKKIAQIDNIKIKMLGNLDVIFIPLFDANDKLWSFQKIYPDGTKMFETGGKTKGCFFSFDDYKKANQVILCEGFATGASIYEATQIPTICTFSASNLYTVAKILKDKFQDKTFIICGDEDCWNDNNKNPGREFGKKAALAVDSCAVFPVFKNTDSKPTDFNDLHCLEGIEEVKKQILLSTNDLKEVGKEKNVDEEYFDYFLFFEDQLKDAKKNIISSEMVKFDGTFWQPILNEMPVLKSHAIAFGLKAAKLENHLLRYISERKSELLIERPEWDGVDRINDLGKYIKLKGHEYSTFESALKEWGANVFRRLYDDRVQNRCIILKGNQGIGKDSLVTNLLEAFGPYYAKFSSNRDERECWSQVTSNLILHIEEFDQTGQMTIAFLKDLITRDKVTYRAPYARSAALRKCYGSFISTVNIDAVLRDETGNRRFAVFEIEEIDWNYPKGQSEQIVAQFYELYKSGFKAPKDIWKLVMDGNAQFEQVDLVPELLAMWDDRLRALIEPTDGFTFADIHGVISDLAKSSGWKQRTILTMLKTHNRSKHTKNGTRYVIAKRGDGDRSEKGTALRPMNYALLNFKNQKGDRSF